MRLWGGMGRESRVSDLFQMATGKAFLVIEGLEVRRSRVDTG